MTEIYNKNSRSGPFEIGYSNKFYYNQLVIQASS